VVLGCTHFVLLEEEIRQCLSNGISIIDSREGVTKRIVALLAQYGMAPDYGATLGDPGPSGSGELFLNGGSGEEGRYRAYAEHFGLGFCGTLEEM
jgi:glutamate racemase